MTKCGQTSGAVRRMSDVPPEQMETRCGWSLVLDVQGTVLFVEPELEQRLGYSPREWQGMHMEQYVVFPRLWRTGLVDGSTDEQGTLYFVNKQGGVQTGMYRLCRSAERSATVTLWIEGVRFAQEQRVLQQFMNNLLTDIYWGVLLVDDQFRLIEVSQTACSWFGWERLRVLGIDIDELFGSLPEEHRFVQKSILQGVAVQGLAFSWMGTTGRYEFVMDAHTVKCDAGRVIGAYVILKDVTNMRTLEQQVQRNDRFAMIGQIAAGTAHEIRNPLTAMKGFMQLLHQSLSERGFEKERQYSEFVLEEIDRMNKLVNEFLYLSKAKPSTYVQVDVAMVLREILPLINNQAVLHDVRVAYQAVLHKPPVIADREQLKQVFMNLCRNGIEAMAIEGGLLTIVERLDAGSQRLHIEIHDTGSGIPPFVIDKIFDPFFTTKDEGTGLGLSVCQRIVHDMGGNIRVSSKGHGTTFIVSIPLRKTERKVV